MYHSFVIEVALFMVGVYKRQTCSPHTVENKTQQLSFFMLPILNKEMPEAEKWSGDMQI